jgi:lipopolysaccharide/colanic/teichoic acid biosynthesis glycosyltransferase
MCVNASQKLEKLLEDDSSLRAEYEKFCKLKEDPRVTRVGKFIRSFSLDELPQVFNIIKGDMSFVGPRPIFEEEIAKYNGNFSDYKSLLPGITGLWQINGRSDTSFNIRVKMDERYARYMNLYFDLTILFKTIPAILSKRGAY